MMGKEVIIALIGGFFGLVSGAVATYVTAILKYRKELEAEFDKEIRKERMRAYPELMRCLDVLARYDRPGPLNGESLANLSIAMRKWFFESGGILLSDLTRHAYFALKEDLQRIVTSSRQRDGQTVEPGEENALITAASLLRAHLAKDLGTRRSPPVADS